MNASENWVEYLGQALEEDSEGKDVWTDFVMDPNLETVEASLEAILEAITGEDNPETQKTPLKEIPEGWIEETVNFKKIRIIKVANQIIKETDLPPKLTA